MQFLYHLQTSISTAVTLPPITILLHRYSWIVCIRNERPFYMSVYSNKTPNRLRFFGTNFWATKDVPTQPKYQTLMDFTKTNHKPPDHPLTFGLVAQNVLRSQTLHQGIPKGPISTSYAPATRRIVAIDDSPGFYSLLTPALRL